jgi:hypothetical protein
MNPFQAPPSDQDDWQVFRNSYLNDPRHLLLQRRVATVVVLICLFIGGLILSKVDSHLHSQHYYIPFPVFLLLIIFPLPGACLLGLRSYLWPQLQFRELWEVLCMGCALGYSFVPFGLNLIDALMRRSMF